MIAHVTKLKFGNQDLLAAVFFELLFTVFGFQHGSIREKGPLPWSILIFLSVLAATSP